MKNDVTCDEILMSAMAIADGESPPVPAATVEAHLAGCPSCREQAAGLAATARLLDGGRRAPVAVDLWPDLERRIAAPPSRAAGLAPFLALAAVLAGYRVLLAAATVPATAVKLLVVAAIVLTFVYVRENPFNIKTELRLETE
jgi:predicted anti-sigma-YlaC factor YlaD